MSIHWALEAGQMGLQALAGMHQGQRRQEGGPMSVLSGQGQARAEKSPHQGMLGAGSWGMEHRLWAEGMWDTQESHEAEEQAGAEGRSAQRPLRCRA